MFRWESERTNRHAKVGAPRSQEATTDPGPLVFFRSSPFSPCIPLMTMIYSAPVVSVERVGAIRDPRGQQSDPLQLPWNVQIRNASQLPPPNSFRCKRFPTRFFRTRRQHHRYKLFRMSGLCKYPLSKSCGFNSLCNLRGEGVPRSGLECPAWDGAPLHLESGSGLKAGRSRQGLDLRPAAGLRKPALPNGSRSPRRRASCREREICRQDIGGAERRYES